MTNDPQSESGIFRAALKLAPELRPAWLDQACAGNPALRQEVESLLRAHDPEGSFLESPAVAPTLHQPMRETPGSIIGPYKLREQIGEGGFGVVYVAEQEHPVRRKVALKVIKPGMDTKDVIARFEAERQALALMDHPNVARVLDAGSTESASGNPGRPYFVMELVQGVTITEFCDRNNLPTRERLALFADVCRAVQHAHQKGIIHRDLKPSNIMVTLHDGKPVAKVIDFGVSKALSQQLTEKSIYTAYGQMIGTPSYMSPEQAEMSGLGIDTRSDIYSLGVLLYELLTGQPPLDARRLRASGYAEILRIIREEEPPLPSQKVSTLGDQATVIAHHRRTDPRQLRRDLSGELDWIVMKCLEKDRGRRYDTANGLARDVERYLRDEPVEACPPSTWYRWKKFSRKHRVWIVTASAFAAVLAIAATVSSWMAARAMLAERQVREALVSERAARGEADAARSRAEGFSRRLREATQYMTDGVEATNQGDWAAAYAAFAKAEEVEPELGMIYAHRGTLFTTIGLWDRAAEDYDRRFQFPNPANAQVWYEHAVLQLATGDEPGYRKTCQAMMAQFGDSWSDQVSLIRACLLSPQPPVDPADLVRRCNDLLVAEYSGFHLHLSGVAHLRMERYDQSAIEIRACLERVGSTPGGVHRYGNLTLAIALHQRGESTEAEEALSKGEAAIEEWTLQMAKGSVGTMPIDWWDWMESQLYLREAKVLIRGEAGPEDSRLADVRKRALAAITQGDAGSFMTAGREAVARRAWDDAAQNFSRVLDNLPMGFQPVSQEMQYCVEIVREPELFDRLVARRPDDSRLWYARARTFATRSEWAKASTDLAQALRLAEEKLKREGAEHLIGSQRTRATMMHELAALQLLAGDVDGYRALRGSTLRAESEFEDGLALSALSRALSVGPDAGYDPSSALRLGQQAVAVNPNSAWILFSLGAAQLRAGQYEEAVETLHRSLEIHPTWQGRGQNFVVLAMACHRLGRNYDARDWLEKSRVSLAELDDLREGKEFGLAASNYLVDWLMLRLLMPEAEKMMAE